VKLTKKQLKDMIKEEQQKMIREISDFSPEAEAAASEEYKAWVVEIAAVAQETLKRIDGGEDPADAAHLSRLNQLAISLLREDFYHFFHG
jgi:hypothetical protein